MHLPRRLKGISENSRQSGSVVHLPVKTGSLPTRNSIMVAVHESSPARAKTTLQITAYEKAYPNSLDRT